MTKTESPVGSAIKTTATDGFTETSVLLHPRVVTTGQEVNIQAIFANAPTGFLTVSFSCSEGYFLNPDGSITSSVTTGTSGHTLRGFTFWRSAEATWIAPKDPTKAIIVATLRSPDGNEWFVRGLVDVREKVSPSIRCEADQPVWVAYLSNEERVRISIRLYDEHGFPSKNAKVHITTDRGALVTKHSVLGKRVVSRWEAVGETEGLQDYRPVAREETVLRQEERYTTTLDCLTDEQGNVILYLDPRGQFGVAHVSVQAGSTVETLPVILLSPAGLRMMFSGGELAFAEQPELIKVILLDEYGSPIANERVTFHASIGMVEPAQQLTNVSGECTVALYSAGVDGYATVTAKAMGYVAKHYTRVHDQVFLTNLRPLSLPTIRIDVYAPAEVRPAGAGFPSSETRGTVFVVADNSPAMPLSIYVSVQPLQYSGGHQHHSSRPAGTCTPWQGILVGGWSTTYVASTISGEEQIRVIPSASFPFNPQPQTPAGRVRVRVPNLQDLSPGEGYTLVGITATHQSNHWAASDVITNLQSIARDFRIECGSQSGYLALNYNDISLIWGGLFDIRADWTPPHHEHRRGREVDFSNADDLPPALQTTLRNIIQRYSGRVLNESNHWHVRF
ncbi:MAG: hypothetical protein KatS3mg022_3060 [Armatimonadota bacterium]|nr:MAG: hypothetical protein KatS3mg022_3060 [Armatimonadota bacterium]